MRGVAPLILCYHGVSSEWTNPTSVSPGVMARQLALLRARDYVGFTLSELVSRGAEGTLPRRSLAVTFDDGYASTVNAKPVLDDVGYPATVFVVTDFVESGELLSWPGIEQWRTGAQSRELASLRQADPTCSTEAGWESVRTRGHIQVSRHSQPRATRGRDRWVTGGPDRRLGRCDTLAYPYGLTSAAAIDVVESSGYSAACVVRPRKGEQGRFCVPRIGLYGNDTGLRLRAKLSPSCVCGESASDPCPARRRRRCCLRCPHRSFELTVCSSVRIVYVTATLPFGREESFVLPEIASMLRRGHEVRVVPIRPRGEIIHREIDAVVKSTVSAHSFSRVRLANAA